MAALCTARVRVMNHRNNNSNNNQRSRAGKAGGTGTGHAAPLSSNNNSSNKAADTAAAVVDASEFVFVQALLQNSSSTRLNSIQRQLKNVVTAVSTVVRGTDSQRRFTSTYTEFCMSAVRCMADLEEAVYEYTHPGSRAVDAADDAIEGIAEDHFLKQVAAYVATQTSSLGLAYLEHVALAALEKHQQQRKRERTSASTAGQRPTKSSRSGGSSSGVGSGNNRAADSNPGCSAFDALGLIDAQDTMREAMQSIEREKKVQPSTSPFASASLSNATSAPAAGAKGSRRRDLQVAATTQLGSDNTVMDSSRHDGLFISKGLSTPGGDGGSKNRGGAATTSTPTNPTAGQVVYDLRNPALRLTSIPELAMRLQPWTLPLPPSGVFLERVTMERDRKGTGGGGGGGSAMPSSSQPPALLPHGSGITAAPGTTSSCTNASAAPGLGGPHAAHLEQPRAILDVCLAASPMELLKQYEAHETARAVEQQQSPPSTTVLPASQSTATAAAAACAAAIAAGPYSVVPYAGNKSRVSAGGSPRTTATLATPPLSAVLPDADAVDAVDAGGGGSSLLPSATSPFFFPAPREHKTLTCLPLFALSNLSHFGVSKMESVYTMTPTGK